MNAKDAMKLVVGKLKKVNTSIYEYTTMEYTGAVLSSPETINKEMTSKGWSKVWCDVTQEGTFVVYRRRKQPEVFYNGAKEEADEAVVEQEPKSGTRQIDDDEEEL